MLVEGPRLTIEDTDAPTPELLFEQDGVKVQGRIVSPEKETENTRHLRFQLLVTVNGVGSAVRNGVAGVFEYTWLGVEGGQWISRAEAQEKFSVEGFVEAEALKRVREWAFRTLEGPMLLPDTALEPIGGDAIGDQAAK